MHDSTDHGCPKSAQLHRLENAHKRLLEIEARHKHDKEEARAELRSAARGLVAIENASDRLATVAWAVTNTSAAKSDLAWVIFGKEHQEYHLRRLLAGPYRACEECGQHVLAGHRFEDSSFYCERCSTRIHAERRKESNGRELRYQAKRIARDKRIAELKRKGHLSDVDTNELFALIFQQVDGPSFEFMEFVEASVARQSPMQTSNDYGS